VLCAVHPEQPFDFAEKAYWLQRDGAFKAFVDQWLHIAVEDGSRMASFPPKIDRLRSPKLDWPAHQEDALNQSR
jgi:hypothetical protein